MGAENAIRSVGGRGIPLPGADIDTDRIIPARYMKAVTFEGLGEHAFHDARFDAAGKPTEHSFNDRKYEGASILIVGRNFGCGSSREHAPQALMRWGIRAIVGESFAEIFAGNCGAIGVPAVRVPAADVERLMRLAEEKPETEITVNLAAKTVKAGSLSLRLDMPEATRRVLVDGSWDTTTVLLRNKAEIAKVASRLPYLGGFGA